MSFSWGGYTFLTKGLLCRPCFIPQYNSIVRFSIILFLFSVHSLLLENNYMYMYRERFVGFSKWYWKPSCHREYYEDMKRKEEEKKEKLGDKIKKEKKKENYVEAGSVCFFL